ncbi:methyltransferase domain-containing protein [Pseudooceanicola sp. CBS1P-1]|uniref:Methyltransferase domain-containing protein n=1 Tax=Pseudooceanicola albus TaxID=2692189 RepID=A0A6L7GAF4_9RHOB|nr:MULTISPECIES: RsmB/NOP family class I SAM-dependent RNA methyltransferase [Pseudooceanicola]MBT9384148.1 methyltransferase domain-containing protein [Pseudooceanicola endophyticus]MXN19753.1 methyltransferase domain-containing protein [Pseudooceanicola albus]
MPAPRRPRTPNARPQAAPKADTRRAPSARGAALRMLNEVLGEEPRLLADLSDAPWAAGMAGADRARAQRLAAETLRGLERCDRLLAKHLKKLPPLPVRNVLRIATWELAHGEAAHGVVNDAVNAVSRMPRQGHLKGLVNAVLRKIADEAPSEWPKLRAPRLPDWLREPLVAAYSSAQMLAFEAAHAAGAPLDLTPRDPAQAADWAEKLGGVLLPTGSVRLAEAGQISALPGYEEGAWWVQDAAAALPVKLLAPKQGEKILDLCAAPGGKTLQVAAAGAEVTAVDLSAHRLKRLEANLKRTGLKATVIAGDAMEHEGRYDAILLDAPCSATGTIRRHPDLPHARDGAEIGDLIGLQSFMIDHALSLLNPGGRLVFCTCSLIPDEGECQIEEALERHPDLRVDRSALERPGIDPAWITEEGGLRLTPDLWPDLGGMDGFYMAVLTR